MTELKRGRFLTACGGGTSDRAMREGMPLRESVGKAAAPYSRGGSRAVLAGMENDVAARYGAVGNGAAFMDVGRATMKDPRKAGFTLIELIVVVLIIGVLAALAVPQYIKTMETSKADDALSTVQIISTTNRMFFLDRNNFNSGAFPPGSCGAGSCPASPTYTTACDLVYCGYLANQDFGPKPYQYYVCDGVGGGGGCCSANGGTAVACAQRKGAGAFPVPPATTSAYYQQWGYTVDRTGAVQTLGSGTPSPSS